MKRSVDIIKYTYILPIMIICMIILSSCAKEQPVDPAADAAEEVKEEKTLTLVTEEDYRNALADITDDNEKLKIFDEFAAGYRLTEDEYIEYASLCAKAGDTVKQREVLYKLYVIDPTEAHGELLSDAVYHITDKEDDKAGSMLVSIVDELKKCGDGDFSCEGIRSIIDSDDWKKSFYIDNGTFTSKTDYTDGSISASVISDSLSTSVTATFDNVRYKCELTFGKDSVGYVELKDGKPEGKYCYRVIDNGVDIVLINSYYKNGHYVNQFEITTGGVKYSGSFDDEGKTKETQPQDLNGVVYAYTEDGSNYLYVEDTDVSGFVADAVKMGFEGFEE